MTQVVDMAADGRDVYRASKESMKAGPSPPIGTRSRRRGLGRNQPPSKTAQKQQPFAGLSL